MEDYKDSVYFLGICLYKEEKYEEAWKYFGQVPADSKYKEDAQKKEEESAKSEKPFYKPTPTINRSSNYQNNNEGFFDNFEGKVDKSKLIIFKRNSITKKLYGY